MLSRCEPFEPELLRLFNAAVDRIVPLLHDGL
jgi:hypothetical protein